MQAPRSIAWGTIALLISFRTVVSATSTASVRVLRPYGRKGRLFTVHFRNVRGSLAASGGYEEVLLDDGDMNMARILHALQQVGFAGCINPDHIPALEGDDGPISVGLAYSVGYIKALSYLDEMMFRMGAGWTAARTRPPDTRTRSTTYRGSGRKWRRA